MRKCARAANSAGSSTARPSSCWRRSISSFATTSRTAFAFARASRCCENRDRWLDFAAACLYGRGIRNRKAGSEMARTPVLAAGGIVLRQAELPLVAVVRLRKRNEWALPKGKLDTGETRRAGAQHRERGRPSAEVRVLGGHGRS